MKKIFTHTAIMFGLAFILSLQVVAQGIYQFWGTTINGGPDREGTIFTMKHDGTGQRIIRQFEVDNPGGLWSGNKPVALNGKLYTIFGQGGVADAGLIMELDPVTNSYTRKADLFTIGGEQATTYMVVYNNKLYGTTDGGGNYGRGLLFEFDPVSNSLVKRFDFTGATGEFPGTPMIVFNNKLYGITFSGGNNDDGVIYEFDPATNNYAVELHLNEILHGRSSQSGLVAYNNLLWGVTGLGGAGGDGGCLFSYNPATNIYTHKKNMTEIGFGQVWGTPVVLNNKLYGCAGALGLGGIYEYDPATNVLAEEFSFTANIAYGTCEMLVYDNKLYGMANGGVNSFGVIFNYDPATNTYATKMNLSLSSGANPSCAMALYNNKMYGWTSLGGAYNGGTLIEYNPVPNGYVKKVDLGSDQDFSNPGSKRIYHNGKVYGFMIDGGSTASGGIYEYDLAASTFTEKYSCQPGDGSTFDGGGMTLFNNKFYGVTNQGGNNFGGTIFEYDPAANTYTIKYHFDYPTGRYPVGKLVVVNGKLYGTTNTGSTNGEGNIYQYDPVTNVFTEKVIFGGAFGENPQAGLISYNNKLYGTTGYGGTNDAGTLFEYDPAINSFIVRANFNEATTGKSPSAELTLYNGMLYGVTEKLEQNSYQSTLFRFNPVTYELTNRHNFAAATGHAARSSLVVMNKKLYGMTTRGGSDNMGVVYEFDPATDVYTKKMDFDRYNGAFPNKSELLPVPAKTAPGDPGNCISANTANINASNNNEWIPFTNEYGEAVAEINANGNNLGNIRVNYYVHNGAVRVDAGGRPYLDRNITISVQNQPVTPVNVRFYIRKNEFDALKNTAGSNVGTIGDLGVFKRDGDCSEELAGTAAPVTSFNTGWREDYVLNASVTSFSTFYFAYRNFTVLPVHILSFTGTKEPAYNKLQWTASCTNPVNFTVQRSTDGIQFSDIAIVDAAPMDCNNPFYYNDHDVASGQYYYRLKTQELNGPVVFSNTVFINRNGEDMAHMEFVPNPVSGATANLQVNATKATTFALLITDASGRVVMKKNIPVSAGTTQQQLDVSNISSGVYYLTYTDEQKRTTIKFVKH